jgi:hypothetical protein
MKVNSQSKFYILKNIESIVVSRLPDAGLGNKLFTWAHGTIFANTNNLRHFSNGVTKIKIGPIIRRENSLRFYANYFKYSKLISKFKLIFLLRNKTIIKVNYSDCSKSCKVIENSIYIFNEIPNWSDYFNVIRENREIVIKNFFNTLNLKIYRKYLDKTPPVIGVHIRMGDFKKIDTSQDFSLVGHTRTPTNYFIDIINKIRVGAEANLSVTVFSDGDKSELSEILSLRNVYLAEKDLDILQMLHLSKSKIIILSAGSTFGQWAAFFSDAAIINHYQHFNGYIRPKNINKRSFEGIINLNDPLDSSLLNYIKTIKNQ